MSRTVMLLLGAVTVVAAEEMIAVVRLTPNDVNMKNVTGNLKIVQSVRNGPVTITGKIYGLSEGLHGFHVHEKGDLTDGCISAGAHFNPENVTHGAPEDNVRHVGDLGNVQANSEGEAVVNITDNIISLNGPNNILGRSFVVHSGEDDLGKGNSTLSLTTGNSGDRWACGVVGIQ
ncbi:superoxide dismutase [Cu-Zn], chloroplastic isoform X4 [Harpegnathos saltator]|nr:superoxide dismutase [Cu-Zn], chloroplastic isoform X4 [Harpegnathos saltator]XP_025154760.1 superoxide dismutase [Cu-Zn], chloroplastic isoform X4 [Harpegnathos saltator]